MISGNPALGRFLSRDPLNRVPLFFSEQPYAYAGNNPLIHVDPSGQRFYIQGMSGAEQAQVNKMAIKAARKYRTKPSGGKPSGGGHTVTACPTNGPCSCPPNSWPCATPAPAPVAAPRTPYYQGCENKPCVLRHNALDAVAAYQSVEDNLVDFLSMLRGFFDFKSKADLMDSVRSTLAGLDDLRQQFLNQSRWDDSRWTAENILAFERSTAVKAHLVGWLEWSLAGTLATVLAAKGVAWWIRFLIGEFATQHLPGFGDAVGTNVGAFIADFYITKEKADFYYSVDLGY